MAEQQGLKCKPTQKFLPNQRKRSMVTLETKMEIVCVLQKGNSERVVAERFGSPDLQWATFGSIARKSKTAFRRASRWYMQRNAVSCVNQNLSLWIRLVGSGFVSSAQREHL